MSILKQQELASGDDAICTQTGSSYSSTGTFVQINRHTSTANASSAGFRFQLPSDLDPASIQTARLVLRPVNGGNTSIPGYQVLAERTPAAAWANDATNRPNARYTTAVSNGSTPQTWDINGWHSSTPEWLPDVSTDIKAAMNHGSYVPGTSYVGIIINGPIGSPVGAQWGTYDNSTVSNRPVLRITYTDDETVGFSEVDVPYTDHVGSPENRNFKVYVPDGTPPAGGWPLVIWIHGGFWTTMGDPLPAGFITYVNDTLGRVIVDVNYKLVSSNIVGSNTGRSFPDPVHDLLTFTKFMETYGDEWRVNMERAVITGHSAGGHVAISTAIMGQDTASYTGYDYNSARTESLGATRPQFILDRDLVLANSWKGAFAWAAPIDVWEVTQHPDGGQRVINNAGRTGYMGGILGTDPTFGSDELDINKYIDGSSFVYGPTQHEPNIPIGFAEALSDDLVIPSASADALYDAVTTSGFTYEAPAVGTITATGLTRFEYADEHDTVIENETSWADFGDWLYAVDPDPPPPEYRRNAGLVIS